MRICWRHSRLHTRIVVFAHATLYTASSHYYTPLYVSIIQNTSLLAHSTLWDESAPTFLYNFCVHSDTATRLKTPSFVPRIPSLAVRLCNSETKFVERTLEECLNVTVHLQSSTESLFLGDSWVRFEVSSVPAGFLQQQYTNRETQGSQQAGKARRDTRKLNTLQSSRIPSNEFSQNNPDDTIM